MGTDTAIALDIPDKCYNEHQTVNLEFQNITYQPKYKCKKERKILLNNVSGKFTSGRMTGIMGPSGAGKSSLLNVLSGFKRNGLTGTIFLNDEPIEKNKFRQNSAYITQDVSMLPNIKTIETLDFAAELKLPHSVPKDDKRKIVNDIIKLLGLEKCTDSLVKHLSGGEKKRLSIGVELVTNPQILFLDEPTSGLDSVSAAQIMRYLKDLANSGRNIICVIHQPTSSLLQLFDDLYILSDGDCIYKGTLDNMVPTFEAAGFDCPNYYNRADFALEIASLKHEGMVKKLIEMASSVKCENNDKFIEMSQAGEKTKLILEQSPFENDSSKQYPISQWRQFVILTRRTNLCTMRDLQLAKMRIFLHILVAVLLGVVFFNVGSDAAKITTNSACLFFFLLFLFFANSMPVVLSFPLETGVFLREHCNNWYSLRTYYFSKLVADFPLLILGPTSFVLIAYYMTAQPYEGCRLILTWIMCVLTAWISQVLGLIAGSIFCMELGVFTVPASAIPMLIFSGFFIRFRELFSWLKPITYISYFRYSFEGSIQAIYGFNRQNLPCSEKFCYFSTINKFLEYIDMQKNNYLMDVLALFSWIVVLHILLYVALSIRLKRAQ